MWELITLPFRLAWSVLTVARDIVWGCVSLACGLVGGIFSLLLGVAVLVLLVALISRAFRDSGRGHGHPYRDNARDDDFISFYDKDAVK